MNKIDSFVEAYKDLVSARIIKRNLDAALTGNLPKHKIRKYQSVVTNGYVRLRNARTRAEKLYSKLSELERSQADRIVGGWGF